MRAHLVGGEKEECFVTEKEDYVFCNGIYKLAVKLFCYFYHLFIT